MLLTLSTILPFSSSVYVGGSPEGVARSFLRFNVEMESCLLWGPSRDAKYTRTASTLGLRVQLQHGASNNARLRCCKRQRLANNSKQPRGFSDCTLWSTSLDSFFTFCYSVIRISHESYSYCQSVAPIAGPVESLIYLGEQSIRKCQWIIYNFSFPEYFKKCSTDCELSRWFSI